MVWPDFELVGETVRLRPLVRGDVDGLVAAGAESREHFQFTTVPAGRDEALAYVEHAERMMMSGARLVLATIWNDRLVGSTSFIGMPSWQWPEGSPLQRVDRPDSIEIGATWLAASAQRTRCNTESKTLMLTHAFDVWHVHAVRLRTDERNARSRRGIERLGAVLEGVIRADVPAQDARPRNSASYSITRDEWLTVSARLGRRLDAVREGRSSC
jgi:RimJ/RimL family protein N-acetyltransferase